MILVNKHRGFPPGECFECGHNGRNTNNGQLDAGISVTNPGIHRFAIYWLALQRGQSNLLISIWGLFLAGCLGLTSSNSSGLARVIEFPPLGKLLFLRTFLYSYGYSRPSSPHKCGVRPGTLVAGKITRKIGAH